MDFLPLELLPDLSAEETQEVEYKSARGVAEGQTNAWEKARAELQKAASGFWNSGGGAIWFGLGDDGQPEEWRFPLKKGKQPIRDWVDKALAGVEPVGPYTIEVHAEGQDAESGVVGVSFEQSPYVPHMVKSEARYYVRAGRHTEPASHYLVEALFARRGVNDPAVAYAVEDHDGRDIYYDIVLYATGGQPAFDVECRLFGLSGSSEEGDGATVGVLMPDFPFRLPKFQRPAADDMPEDARIQIRYRDRAGQIYEHVQDFDLASSLLQRPEHQFGAARITTF